MGLHIFVRGFAGLTNEGVLQGLQMKGFIKQAIVVLNSLQ